MKTPTLYKAWFAAIAVMCGTGNFLYGYASHNRWQLLIGGILLAIGVAVMMGRGRD